jgi:hypothetical protein
MTEKIKIEELIRHFENLTMEEIKQLDSEKLEKLALLMQDISSIGLLLNKKTKIR